MVTTDTSQGATLRDYLAVVWRRKWLVLLVVVLATGVAYGLSAMQTKMYAAAAQLIYENSADLANPLSSSNYVDPTQRTVELQSVAPMLTNPELEKRAEALIAEEAGTGAEDTDYAVSAEVVAGTDQAAGTTTYSSVVAIGSESSDAELAAVIANSYAAAFISLRTDQQVAQISDAIDVVQTSLKRMKTQAQKASSDYILLQQRLHDLQILEGTATGGFRVIVPATTPDAPYAPKPWRSAAIGLALGLFVGLGLAFLLELLDTSVRSDGDVAELLRQPILARIPRISKRLLDQSALVTITEPDGTSAEAFRMLRTNLSFMNVDGEVRSVVLTSCLQGEGKSVTVANLAVTLALGGKKVVVVDADLRRPRMHKYFGLKNEIGVSTVVTGQTHLSESLQAVPVMPQPGGNGVAFADWAAGSDARSRLYVLPSGPQTPNPGEIVSSKRLAGVIEALAQQADIVLVDSPAMLAVGDTPALADKVDGLLFLVEPDVVRKQTLARAREQLDKLPCRLLGVIVARRKAGSSYYAPRYYYREAEDGRQVRAGRASAPSSPTPPGVR
ncbi:MAG TPA: Wzz/FepE/Etk N-terminal domain-containing protein [Thermoleophilia bacterium]|nr:Wzz/FepE/Etk N-terminal domain-containing protein [Thermoleophilia bacterium]